MSRTRSAVAAVAASTVLVLVPAVTDVTSAPASAVTGRVNQLQVPGTVEVDQKVTITGTIGRGKRGVQLQIRPDGTRTWNTVGRTSTNAQGAFVFASHVFRHAPANPLPKPMDVRVYAPSAGDRPADTTVVKRVRVVNPRPGTLGPLSLVSVGSDERLGDGTSGENGYTTSGDGRYVVFDSNASWTDPTRKRLFLQVFLRDRVAGTTTLVSRALDGRQPRGHSFVPFISADGTWVVFWSEAAGLVKNDSNGRGDMFWWNRETGRITMVKGLPADTKNRGVRPLALSADGRFLAFASNRPDLAPAPKDGSMDLYVLDRQSGIAEQMPTPPTDPGLGIDEMFAVSMSDDGRYVAYAVDVDERDPWDYVDNRELVFVDRTLGTTRSIPMDPAGIRGANDDLDVRATWMSADGGVVAYSAPVADGDSYATNDTAVYLWHSSTGEAEMMPGTFFNGSGETGRLLRPSLSADTRYVALRISAGYDTYLYRVDTAAGTAEELVTYRPGSHGYTPNWGDPVITADGSTVMFGLDAREAYVPHDVNEVRDVFAWVADPG
ncbi:hypothetical protein F0U44_08560 [Nocardioides humilatus]|uniref:WD40-like Beta Propeller Repeat n=1 Tax=Nocardioides humilatus TaxID=2607660 RepID=A0A5B1LFJ4_9ACTN|nr:PD40 domain-containing protein [Nocardioides humilatus]KAA1418550.1 hypothetical protein F0U44_08560 [Nocardioides humilatus]